MKRRGHLRFAAVALLLAAALVPAFAQSKPVTITWWEFPNFGTIDNEVGKYERQVAAAFQEKYPNIKINLEMLDFAGGPAKVNVAITSGTTPDIIFDAPGRIIDWAKTGALVPLDDLFAAPANKDIYPGVLEACQTRGKFYMYPLNFADFNMAVNVDLFKKAGLEKMLPLDRPERTWTTAEFTAALKAIQAKYPDIMPVIVFSKGSGGDQGTRWLVQNLYGGDLMNKDKTAYTSNTPEFLKALQWIKDGAAQGYVAKGGEALTGTDSIQLFNQQKAAFVIVWSQVARSVNMNSRPVPFQDAYLSWPTPDGKNPRFEAFIGGLCIFDNKDADKVAASKKFIDFLCNDPVWGKKNLMSTGGFSPHANVPNPYSDPEIAWNYKMLKYTGRYFNTVDGFPKMRTFWFPMMQEMTLGLSEPKVALDKFTAAANDSIKNP